MTVKDLIEVLQQCPEPDSEARADGTMTVFSRYWVNGVPVIIFAGEQPLGHRSDEEP